MLKPENLYHTGIIVDDIEAAKAWYTKVAGYKWCDTAKGEQLIKLADGPRNVTMMISYSMNEPRIELIQTVAGTIWVPSGVGVHHLGYWSSDVEADMATLLKNGSEFEASSDGPDGKPFWAYCRHQRWGRIELVSEAMQPLVAQWFATGKL